MTRIVLADDHTIITDGLQVMLGGQSHLEIVGVAQNGDQAFDLVSRLRPDLLLTDIEMDGLDGIDLVQKIRDNRLQTRIIVLSMHDDLQFVNTVLKNGADGYVLKNAGTSVLTRAIEEVMSGKQFICPAVSEKMLRSYLKDEKASEANPYGLSAREVEIVKLLSEGHSSKKIGDLLHLSPHTVDTHRKNIHVKLGVHSTAELIRFALKNHLIR